MTEEDLKIFVTGTSRYFAQVADSDAEIATPYEKDSTDAVIYDFAAVIGITGSQRGCVYFTAPRSMVAELVARLGEPDSDDDILADYVGEIANTISGNAREQLGSGFMISVPVVFRGRVEDVRFPRDTPAFVIPIYWNKHRSALIICLKDGERNIRVA
jgi:chemotaxis protein CheX